MPSIWPGSPTYLSKKVPSGNITCSSSEARQQNAERIENLCLEKAMERDTINSIEQLNEKVAVVVLVEVIKIRGNNQIIFIKLTSSVSPEVQYCLQISSDLKFGLRE